MDVLTRFSFLNKFIIAQKKRKVNPTPFLSRNGGNIHSQPIGGYALYLLMGGVLLGKGAGSSICACYNRKEIYVIAML